MTTCVYCKINEAETGFFDMGLCSYCLDDLMIEIVRKRKREAER